MNSLALLLVFEHVSEIYRVDAGSIVPLTVVPYCTAVEVTHVYWPRVLANAASACVSLMRYTSAGDDAICPSSA
jgi:hypothetical protein